MFDIIRLNSKVANRRLWLSFLLSLIVNGGVTGLLLHWHAGVPDHVFHLLAIDDTVLEMEVGSAYSLLPTAPRYASAVVIGEDRYAPAKVHDELNRSRPAEEGAPDTAPATVEPGEHQPVALAPEYEAPERPVDSAPQRRDVLDEPSVRIAPEENLAPLPQPSRGDFLSAMTLTEERYSPSDYLPTLDHARPDVVQPAAPTAVQPEERGHEPVGVDNGDEPALSRELPVRARPAVMESPGVYVPVDMLRAEPVNLAQRRRLVWLVEEKRYEKEPAETAPVPDRQSSPPEELRQSTLPQAVSPMVGEIPRREIPRIGLSRRPPTRLIAEPGTSDPEPRSPPPAILEVPPEPEPEPEPLPDPEPEPEAEPEPEPEEPAEPDSEEPDEPEELTGPLDGYPELAEIWDESWRQPSIAEGFAVMYPERSIRRGESGIVVVEGVIDEDGRVRSPRVFQSSGYPSLDAAAIDAVFRARFRRTAEDEEKEGEMQKFPIVFMLN